jgi:hypothetical protein
MDGDDDNEEDPFGFPIQETDINVQMKNIHPSVLPNFKGMRSEDPKTFQRIKCIGGNPKKINIAKKGEKPKYLKIVNCWDDMTIVEAISL